MFSLKSCNSSLVSVHCSLLQYVVLTCVPCSERVLGWIHVPLAAVTLNCLTSVCLNFPYGILPFLIFFSFEKEQGHWQNRGKEGTVEKWCNCVFHFNAFLNWEVVFFFKVTFCSSATDWWSWSREGMWAVFEQQTLGPAEEIIRCVVLQMAGDGRYSRLFGEPKYLIKNKSHLLKVFFEIRCTQSVQRVFLLLEDAKWGISKRLKGAGNPIAHRQELRAVVKAQKTVYRQFLALSVRQWI